MKEAPSKDPVPPPVDKKDDAAEKRKGFFARIAQRFARLFGVGEEPSGEEDKQKAREEKEQEKARRREEKEKARQEKEKARQEKREKRKRRGEGDSPSESPAGETPAEGENPFAGDDAPKPPDGDGIVEPAPGEGEKLQESPVLKDGDGQNPAEQPASAPAETSAETSADAHTEAPAEPPAEPPAEAGEPAEAPGADEDAPGEEQIVLHTEGEDLFAIDGVPDDLDILMPITPSRYQKECFLKFGFDEIDERLRVEDVAAYLRVRGWSGGDLSKARRRGELESWLEIAEENRCDFCGVPLTGVSYDRLADGRTRCNDCSMTAVSDVETFRALFRSTETLLEDVYDITVPVAIAVRTTDARTIARHVGQVFKPSTKVAPRVLGFAQRKNGRYSLFIENGSPRLAALDTTAHEMTHIWQYLNWKDPEILRIYRQRKPAWTRLARDIVYEGMATWSAVQLLYALGETSYARRQELLTAARTDVYGIGFRLYRDRYDFERSGEAPAMTPFHSFPPLDPEEVRRVFDEAEAEGEEES
jgi:hypothetical protein